MKSLSSFLASGTIYPSAYNASPLTTEQIAEQLAIPALYALQGSTHCNELGSVGNAGSSGSVGGCAPGNERMGNVMSGHGGHGTQRGNQPAGGSRCTYDLMTRKISTEKLAEYFTSEMDIDKEMISSLQPLYKELPKYADFAIVTHLLLGAHGTPFCCLSSRLFE